MPAWLRAEFLSSSAMEAIQNNRIAASRSYARQRMPCALCDTTHEPLSSSARRTFTLKIRSRQVRASKTARQHASRFAVRGGDSSTRAQHPVRDHRPKASSNVACFALSRPVEPTNASLCLLSHGSFASVSLAFSSRRRVRCRRRRQVPWSPGQGGLVLVSGSLNFRARPGGRPASPCWPGAKAVRITEEKEFA